MTKLTKNKSIEELTDKLHTWGDNPHKRYFLTYEVLSMYLKSKTFKKRVELLKLLNDIIS